MPDYKLLSDLLERSASQVEVNLASLGRAKKLCAWLTGLAVLGIVAFLPVRPFIGLQFLVMGALSILATVRLSSASDILPRVVNELRGGLTRRNVRVGECVSLSVDSTPLGTLTPYVLGEVLSMKGDTGSARILSSFPEGNRYIARPTGALAIGKGAIVDFYRDPEKPEDGLIIDVPAPNYSRLDAR